MGLTDKEKRTRTLHSSKGKDEKLRLLKSKQSRKATIKLKKLERSGKLKRYVVDKIHDVKLQRSSESRKRVHNIEEDWQMDREQHYATEADEDILPLDMLDADIDWENSGFASLKRRMDARAADSFLNDAGDGEEEDDEKVFEGKKRKFVSELGEDQEEMLPIKLADGTIMRPTRQKQITGKEEDQAVSEPEESDDENDVKGKGKKEKFKQEDYSHLSAADLILKRKEIMAEQKALIAKYSQFLLSDPQENIFKLRELFRLCTGQGVHSLVREKIQQLAVASMIQVLLDIIPGYAIRPLTEAEKGVQLKKETKKLVNFEEALLRYYIKFLQFVEKQAMRLNQKLKAWDETTFSHKMAVLGVKSMCRLLVGVPHFNYSTNIVSALIKLSLTSHQETLKEVCNALSRMFREDVSLKMSLFATKAIADLVKKKLNEAPPALLGTLLHLHIKEVANEDKKSDRNRLEAKRHAIKKERKSKSAAKYDKQIKKLESDLKEVEAEEEKTDKLKSATDTMKQVFQIYFSIIKRMPNLFLLTPVLEGLSKYAHLLNVEFFEDIIKSMEELVDQQHLRLMDQLHCVNTVFVILSGDGHVLNVDPFRFYRSVYRMINLLPFEKSLEMRRDQMKMLARSLDLMINGRRKQVPLMRVAAFVRRLLTTATLLDDHSAALILTLVRTFFIAHPKLTSLVEEDDSEVEGGSAMFRADLDDPDCCKALGSDVRPILRILSMRENKVLASFADNILHGVPSTGPKRINPQWSSLKPWTLLDRECPPESKNALGAHQQVTGFAKKTAKQQLTSKNIQVFTEQWVENHFK